MDKEYVCKNCGLPLAYDWNEARWYHVTGDVNTDCAHATPDRDISDWLPQYLATKPEHPPCFICRVDRGEPRACVHVKDEELSGGEHGTIYSAQYRCKLHMPPEALANEEDWNSHVLPQYQNPVAHEARIFAYYFVMEG